MMRTEVNAIEHAAVRCQFGLKPTQNMVKIFESNKAFSNLGSVGHCNCQPTAIACTPHRRACTWDNFYIVRPFGALESRFLVQNAVAVEEYCWPSMPIVDRLH